MRILIVEDEKDLAYVLSETLELEGYNTDIAIDGEYGLDCALSGLYDLIILDVMLPKINGFEVLKRLRTKNINSAVLMLTARSQIEDKVEGLDSGADDYLTKPFITKEFLARVRALCRRRPNEYVSDRPQFGDIILDTAHHELHCGNKRIMLSKKEYDLIELLILNNRKVIGKDIMITKIWGYETDVEYNSIEVYISFLRKKMKALNSAVSIQTARGVGYFLAEAENG